jgi:succinate dehydrogenase / fumarate reductase cytochrome b subunit
VGYGPGEFKPEDPVAGFQVYSNVVTGFQAWPVSVFYLLAMLALGLHIHHGTWSFFQSLGWNNRKRDRALRALGALVALAVAGGNISVPVAVLAGWVR